MPRKTYAVKGQPDFHTIGDDRLKDYRDFAQQMMFSYKGVNPDAVKVLESIWKDLSDEITDRLVESPSVQTRAVVRPPKALRVSPVRRKI